MRNDAHDELDNIPSLTAGRDRVEPYPAPDLEPIRKGSGDYTDDTRPRQKRRPASGGKASTAPLWVVVLALLISLGALGWWSYQKIAMLEMQLVATQESFARISEDAAGRLQDISGKVVATESNVTTESEAVKLRIKQLEQQAIDLARQQQAFATEQQSLAGRQGNQDQRMEEQGKRLERLGSDVQSQQGTTASLAETVKTLGSEQATLKSALDEQAKLAGRIDSLSKDVAALKQGGNQSQAISRLEQDILVLRSEVENRPAPANNTNTAEFDSFRAQVTRTINAMQGQIANLQGQIDGR
ncbi:ATPase [Stutzerimonas stutzeri]|uniref:ATPase n=1 Tax=Stutzerimonas stutzeri TaxID=316 RepID=UPI000E3674E0|nr:ATPase [Stutzerimonas stutzeri]MDH0082442.1 ATPase [Stutzerimonas stutzeri]RFF62337.1 ATPase [Stutzerimonas stutzeri]WRQ02085.1 ATPase [Stutzerimonas stutzeri]HAG19035.1 ATPase [Pseudomonas sp.]